MSRAHAFHRLERAFFFFFLIFCQLACQSHAPISSVLPDAFFPLIPGTIWKYRITEIATRTSANFADKVERAPGSEDGGQQLADDSGKAKALGESVIVNESFGSDSKDRLLIIDKAGPDYISRSFSFGSLEGDLADYQLISAETEFLPRPLRPGISWSNTTFPFGDLAQHLKLVQTHTVYAEDNVITVPAGQFSNCMRIQTRAVFIGDPSNPRRGRRLLSYFDWYAPNVGLIKTSLRETGLFGREVARVELTQFRKVSSASVPLPLRADSDHRTPTTYPRLME